MNLNYDMGAMNQWWDGESVQLSPNGSPFETALEYSDVPSHKSSWIFSDDGSISPTLSDSVPIEDTFLEPYQFTYNNFFDQSPLSSAAGETNRKRPTHLEDDLFDDSPTLAPKRCRLEGEIQRSSDSEDDLSVPSLSGSVGSLTEAPAITSALQSKSRPSRSRSGQVKREPSDEMTTSDEKRKARIGHNEIERKYRNRLTSQFELLIETLSLGDSEDNIGGGSCARTLSKAEVLAMATRRIRALEREVKSQNAQLDRLKGDLLRFRDPAFTMMPMSMYGGAPSV